MTDKHAPFAGFTIHEGPPREIAPGVIAGPGDLVGVNAAGRPVRIPWDAQLGYREPADDDPLWWLSFADASRPEGRKFLGAAIIQAPTFAAAITRSHVIGVNPGGEVASMGPIPAGHIAAEWRDRLLTKDEAAAVPPPSMRWDS